MNFEKIATKVSVVSITGNILLSIIKAFAGIVAHSGAMISDAVHSVSDVIGSVIVIIGIKISEKDSDKEHPYGHERFECVAAIILAVTIFLTGLVIGKDAFEKITGGNYENLQVPEILAVVASIISIVIKEILCRYTKFYAKKYDSAVLMASAYDHRSDAFSSVGVLAGIIGARMGFPVLDAIASLIIGILIIKSSVEIFKDAVDKMVDHSCEKELEEQMIECASRQDGVISVDVFHTRVFGNKIYVDIEICADGNQTLNQAHIIAEQVHDVIEKNFPKVKHIMVHVNPGNKDDFFTEV